MVVRRLRLLAVATALLFAGTCRAVASGPSGTEPWYVDQYGGGPADADALLDGRLGIVMSTAPRPMRFIAWRLLHGQTVGRAAGEALSSPCCGTPWWAFDYTTGMNGWLKARAIVTGRQEQYSIETERPGPNNTSVANCFPDAFDTATATLKDRAARYGATSAPVKAWLAAQDLVFQACHDPGEALPAPMPDAPQWLSMDRGYQEAALTLYQGRNLDAAARFAAIARDEHSPWRNGGLYLAARSLIRQALTDRTPSAYGMARGAVATLAAAKPEAMGRDQVQALNNLLEFNEHPKTFLATLQRELDAPAISSSTAVAFRDYTELGEAAGAKPDALDWIDTILAVPAPAPVDASASDRPESVASAVSRYENARKTALAHAVERWRADQGRAWLVAALSLTNADDAATAGLLRAADQVRPSEPAWLSVQHHGLRLTLGRDPPVESRRRLDAILARGDLSVSDRNVFTSQRAQVASSLDDFVRFALRRRLCIGKDRVVRNGDEQSTCIRARWDSDTVQPSGAYDGAGNTGWTGLGEDARAIIDRASLQDRIALARDHHLPAKLRLDIALTSYGRAVQLQDDAAINASAQDLTVLLPPMMEEFRAILRARPGPDKRFAEFLVLAMIPGVRTDLVDYVRPEGRRVADFQRYWTDWIILRRPYAPIQTPALVAYQADGTGFQKDWRQGWRNAWPDSATDLTCLGECGRGAAPLRLPDVFRARAASASHERAYLFTTDHPSDAPAQPMPPGAVDAWDEMLAYAVSNPADPRIPGALHWLVHVGHFGGSHNHSGRRAFRLLQVRYRNSSWAKKTPYYND